MASHGSTRSNKALGVSKVRFFERKKHTWATRCEPGAHHKERSVPLSFVLIALLKIAKNNRESKALINDGKVRIDGVIRKRPRFAVGLFDLVSVEGIKEVYQLVFDKKGRYVVKEVDAKDAKTKLCKVLRKRKVKDGKIRIGTHDGRVFEGNEMNYVVGDTVKVDLGNNKILERFEMKDGQKAYIIAGSHAGEEGIIKGVNPGNIKVKPLVTVECNERAFKTVAKNLMVIE